jgi:hypothetical protein
MQQQQPPLSMVAMQSQHACSMSPHILSPDVHVMQIPSFVISHLHMPIVRLHVHTAMPFIIMQQLTMPPAIMVQRFCIMVHAALSSQVQVIFMPPVHFSIFMVQRGIMSHCDPLGMLIGAVMPPALMEGMAIPVRSIIMLDITRLLLIVNPFRTQPAL